MDMRSTLDRGQWIHSQLSQLETPISVAVHPLDTSILAVSQAAAHGFEVVRVRFDTGTELRTEAVLWRSSVPVEHLAWADEDHLMGAGSRKMADGTHEQAMLLVVPEAQSASEVVVAQEFAVPGPIEQLVVNPDRAEVLVRYAEPGSFRDGMNWALRVQGVAGPKVRESHDQPLRKLARFSLEASGNDAEEAWQVFDLGEMTVWDADWRGQTVVFIGSKDPLPAGYYDPVIYSFDITTGLIEQLYETPWQLAQVRLSPDGSLVAFSEGLSIVSGQLFIMPTHGGKAQAISGADDVTALGWSSLQELWVAGWSDLDSAVGIVTLDDSENIQGNVEWHSIQGTMSGPQGQPSLIPWSNEAYFSTWESVENPPELCVVDLSQPNPQPRAVTSRNSACVRSLPSMNTQDWSWTSRDGQEIHGLLLGHSCAQPQPLVVLIHGGPTWLWSRSFAPGESNQLARVLAGLGTRVLLPNPRGSSGRGQDYARAVIKNVGQADLVDVLTGVESLIQAGVADPARIAVMGLSYGGYQSARAITQLPGTLSEYGFDQFRAAGIYSGVGDWLSFATTSVIGGGFDHVYHPDAQLQQQTGREILLQRSPVTAALELPATAEIPPTLILHGSDDGVTPIGQAEQLFRALTAAGGTVRFVEYPGEGHELMRPEHREHANTEVLEHLIRTGVLPEHQSDEAVG